MTDYTLLGIRHMIADREKVRTDTVSMTVKNALALESDMIIPICQTDISEIQIVLKSEDHQK